MEDVMISIIIPVYNTEQYLEGCLNSALGQSFDAYEIIVVDDGSTDRSPEILKGYGKQYPNKVRLIRQENKGLGGARNTGIEHAKGRYLMFLDSDDCIHIDALKKVYEYIEKTQCDVLVFDMICLDDAGNTVEVIRGCHHTADILSLDKYPQLLFEMPSVCNKVWNRNLFTQNNILFPEKVWYEDLRTSAKLYANAQKIVYMDDRLYIYKQRNSSIMHSKKSKRNLEITQAIDDIRSYFKNVHLLNKYRNEIEFMAIYHVLISAIPRVLSHQELILVLVDYMRRSYPNYTKNVYIPILSKKNRLKLFLIEKRAYKTLLCIMTFYSAIKGVKLRGGLKR